MPPHASAPATLSSPALHPKADHAAPLMHPRRWLQALDALDAQWPSHSLARPQALRRVLITLACVALCLLLTHYAKFPLPFHTALSALARAQGLPADTHVVWLHRSGWLQLATHLWWASWHLLALVVVPCAVVRLVFKEKVIDYGWQWNDTHQHWQGYVLLLAPVLLFVALVSSRDDFVDHYPMYALAGRSGADLLGWELLYLSQFVFIEFFFRGFMLRALRPALGASAIAVMCVPYLMIHLPKLWLEASGAAVFGLFLGLLALQSRSIWGGVLVHCAVALSMDAAALLRKGAWPQQWWPM